MGVFDKETNHNNYLEILVGEDQKYKTNEDLAKAYANADEHISKLTEELQELRDKNNSSTNIEEAVKNLKEKTEIEKVNDKQAIENLSREELLDMVKGELNKDKEHSIKQGNIDKVDGYLVELFGDKAGEMALNKASELNISIQEMKELSAKSPAAVINWFNNGNNSSITSSFKSTVNTLTQSQTVKGGSYYNKLRKENPKVYYSKQVRQEMDKAINTLGENFLKM